MPQLSAARRTNNHTDTATMTTTTALQRHSGTTILPHTDREMSSSGDEAADSADLRDSAGRRSARCCLCVGRYLGIKKSVIADDLLEHPKAAALVGNAPPAERNPQTDDNPQVDVLVVAAEKAVERLMVAFDETHKKAAADFGAFGAKSPSRTILCFDGLARAVTHRQ